MKFTMKRVITIGFGATLALLAPNAGAQGEGANWNAWQDFSNSGICMPCSSSDIGNPSLCPCRINPPIIIQS